MYINNQQQKRPQSAHPPENVDAQKHIQLSNRKKNIIHQKFKLLSRQQIQEWIEFKRLHANQYFKARKYDEAIEQYSEACWGLDTRQKNELILKKTNQLFKYPLKLNIATCLYMKKQFRKSADICKEIISQKQGRQNVKAHYKLASSLVCMSQQAQAKQFNNNCREVIARGIQLLQMSSQHSRNTDIQKFHFQKLLQDLKVKTKKYENKDHKIFTDTHDESQKLIDSNNKKQEDFLVYQQTYSQLLAKRCKGIYRWIKSCFFDERWDKYN